MQVCNSASASDLGVRLLWFHISFIPAKVCEVSEANGRFNELRTIGEQTSRLLCSHA